MAVTEKEINSEWILLTFDLAAEEKSTRYRFLRDVKNLGAAMHSESCYYMPYSEQAYAAAEKLASNPGAVVYVWQSHQVDQTKAKSLTDNYAKHLNDRCNLIAHRIKIAAIYMQEGRLKQAHSMFKKTAKLLNQLIEINESVKYAWLSSRLTELVADLKAVYWEDKDDPI